jgi:hypothetical protein
MSTTPGRPTVDQVAVLIRARTKDSSGNEVGTFDDETRPTAEQTEELIDAAMAVVGLYLPPLDKLGAGLVTAYAQVVALDAACRVEKSYFPEQVRTDRSPYPELRTEFKDALQALVDASEAGGEAGTGLGDFAQIPVGSWTSIPGSFIRPASNGGSGGGGTAGPPGPPGPAGAPGLTLLRLEYQYNVGPEPPTGNQVRVEGTDQTTATKLWAMNLDNSGEDVHVLLLRIPAGSKLYMQDFDDHTAYVEYETTAAPLDKGSYVEFPVAYRAGGGVPAQKVALFAVVEPAVVA